MFSFAAFLDNIVVDRDFDGGLQDRGLNELKKLAVKALEDFPHFGVDELVGVVAFQVGRLVGEGGPRHYDPSGVDSILMSAKGAVEAAFARRERRRAAAVALRANTCRCWPGVDVQWRLNEMFGRWEVWQEFYQYPWKCDEMGWALAERRKPRRSSRSQFRAEAAQAALA